MIILSSKVNKSNIINLFKLEQSSLSSIIDIQKGYNKQIMTFNKNFFGNVNTSKNISDDFSLFLVNNSSTMQKITTNIKDVESLLNVIDNLIISSKTIEYKDLVDKVNKYNESYKKVTKKIFDKDVEIQNFIYSMYNIDISDYMDLSSNKVSDGINALSQIEKAKETETKNQKAKKKATLTKLQENTLIISEISKNVILPYKQSDLRKILRNNSDKYSSLSEIVDTLYTKPIKYYKHSARSRFKEAYNLVVNKEHGRKRDALSLASELMFNYNLHPAIISACGNLNELDIYLSCLEYNELEDFHFFNIKYESYPVIRKKKSKDNLIISTDNI